jgi:apolipoprotein D and lipocalin family protein
MMRTWWLLGAILMTSSLGAGKEPLPVVDEVDLDRYLGTWYEIASYPAWFQKGCTGTTAEYTRLENGRIGVVNRCRKRSLDGKPKTARGRAKVIDETTNAKLKVSFFRPFWGNYWIIDLDPDYRWVVVGEPKRKYLWILSREPVMDEALYSEITARLPAVGYDPTRLRRTLQPGSGGHSTTSANDP